MEPEARIKPKYSNRDSILKKNLNRAPKAHKVLTDYFTQIEDVSKTTFIDVTTGENNKTNKDHSFSHTYHYTYVFALLIIGTIIGVVGFFQALLIQFIWELKALCTSTEYYLVNLLIWVILSLFLTTGAMFASTFIPQSVQESEVAEVKAVIAGVKIPDFFSTKTLLYKLLTVTLALGGGLSIGREGAFIHISSIISTKITKLKPFNYLYKNKNLRSQLLSTSVAAGLASLYGSTIGAIMFSIELSSNLYLVSNMWRAAFCTLCCSIISQSLQQLDWLRIVKSAHFKVLELSADFFIFAFLGLCTGVLGVVFIKLSGFLIKKRVDKAYPRIYGKYRYTIIVTFVTSILGFSVGYLKIRDVDVLNDMFKENIEGDDWDRKDLVGSLFVYILIKFIATLVSTSLELPVGIIFPLLACGSALGRVFGILGESLTGNNYSNIYAAVGAASLVSSVTHSLSISIVVYAMTGEIHYLIPMSISVFISYGISRIFSGSFYDTVLFIKNIAYIPLMRPVMIYNKSSFPTGSGMFNKNESCFTKSLSAEDIAKTDIPCLSPDSTLKDLIDAVFLCPIYMESIPMIKYDGCLLYEIHIKNAKKYIISRLESASLKYSNDSKKIIDQLKRRIVEFNEGSMIELSLPYKGDYWNCDEIKRVLKTKINLSSSDLKADDAPFSVVHSMSYRKIQYMFLMLNLNYVFVTHRGFLVGAIMRDSFSYPKKMK